VSGAPEAHDAPPVRPQQPAVWWRYDRMGLVAVVAICLLGAWALAVHCAASSFTHTAVMRRHLLDVPKLIETQVKHTQPVSRMPTHLR
jgi:hypothetical protein